MKVEIENYRNWQILFDTERENFYAASDRFDMEQIKNTFTSAKKFIDDFIKENQKFKPFFAERPDYNNVESSKVLVVGLRKDGKFVYENSEGAKEQIPESSERNYIVCNEDNKPLYEKINKCKKDIESIEKEIETISEKIIRVTLRQVKSNIINGTQ